MNPITINLAGADRPLKWDFAAQYRIGTLDHPPKWAAIFSEVPDFGGFSGICDFLWAMLDVPPGVRARHFAAPIDIARHLEKLPEEQLAEVPLKLIKVMQRDAPAKAGDEAAAAAADDAPKKKPTGTASSPSPTSASI